MRPETTCTGPASSGTIRPVVQGSPMRGRLFVSLLVPLSVIFTGCAGEIDGTTDDDAGIDRLDGAGADRWQLPTDVRAGFERLFPDADLVTWNRVVTDYGRVAYHLFFEDTSGAQKHAWLTPDGQLTSAPAPQRR